MKITTRSITIGALAIVSAVMVYSSLVNVYISSPGYTTREAAVEFENTKPTCYGYSYLTNPEELAADAMGRSICFGYLVN